MKIIDKMIEKIVIANVKKIDFKAIIDKLIEEHHEEIEKAIKEIVLKLVEKAITKASKN